MTFRSHYSAALLLAISAVACTSENLDDARTQQGGEWLMAQPEAVGLDGQALDRMSEEIRSGEYGNIHAVLIERQGKLAYEAYFTGNDWTGPRSLGEVDFDAETLHDLRSVSKSVVSTLVGIALAQGEIESLETPVAELLPKYADRLQGRKGAITLRHLLTMSSGLKWDEQSMSYADPRNDERRMYSSPDPVGFVLERPLVEEPGKVFNYSGGSTHVLGAILEAATGTSLKRYASKVLFEPLGIEDFRWLGSSRGMLFAAFGLRMQPRDVAKIGSLFLHEGRWNGNQIVPEDWVEEATRFHIAYDDSEDPSFVARGGYGYQWWYNDLKTRRGELTLVAAVGNGGQRIMLLREFDMAVTILSGEYDDPDHFWTPEALLLEHIVPAINRP